MRKLNTKKNANDDVENLHIKEFDYILSKKILVFRYGQI